MKKYAFRSKEVQEIVDESYSSGLLNGALTGAIVGLIIGSGLTCLVLALVKWAVI